MLAFDLPVLLFLVSGAIGMLLTPDREAARPVFLALVWGGIIYLAGALLGRRPRVAQAVLAVLVAAGVLVGTYFLTQAHRFPYPDKIALVTSLRSIAGARVPAVGWWAPFPASVATALECLVFVALALAAGAGSSVERRLWFIAAGVLAVTLVSTASRGAWAATALTGGVWMARRSPRVQAFAVASGVLGAWALSPVARGVLHRQALTLIGDAPFTGVGLAGFTLSLSKYVLLIQVPFLSYSHNLLFDAWLQQGLAGAVAVVWIAAAVIVGILSEPASDPGRASYLRSGCLFGALAVLLHGTTDARPYVDPWCGIPLFLTLGLSRGLSNDRSDDRRRAASKIPALVAAAFTFAVIAWCGSPIAAWFTSRAAVLQARGDSSVAEAALSRALGQDPDYAPAHFRLGLLLLDREAFVEARTHLETAFRAAPESPGRRKALGLVRLWTRDPIVAAEMLKGEPDIVNELNTWATWRAGRGQTELAESALEASLEIEPDQVAVRDQVRKLAAERTGNHR